MAKKGKTKISRVKRNNQTTNKMKKQGQLRLQRHRPKVQKQNQPSKTPEPEYSDSESGSGGEEWADMLDPEEQDYIMKQVAKNPKLLASVPEKDDTGPMKKPKMPAKRKAEATMSPDSGADTDSDSGDEGSDMEEKYEKELSERPAKKMRPLLPIKTKDGVVERSEECKESEDESEDEKPKPKKARPSEEDSDGASDSGLSDDDDETTPAAGGDDEVVTTVQLLAARRDMLNKEKFRIGALCSTLLENPEKKLKNLYPILYLMDEHLKDGTPNLHSVRKIATLSAFEVFKDILPEYMLRHQDYSNVKLKKDTLSLYKYEKELLEFYKRYLQRLEKATSALRPKKGDSRKVDPSVLSLAIESLKCMCGLLAARPHFNYSVNIAQSIVPMLGARKAEARQIVAECCSEVFKEDKKGEISLSIVRLINQLVKRRGSRLPATALDCLLSLRIKDVELDAANDVKQRQALELKKKKRIVNLSKKEKKRAKKLKEVEKELLETEAQESDLARRKQMTEVTKTVFHIYFRILKNEPHSKLLSAVLNGLAKFTHVINLEFYSELISILCRLVEDEAVCERDRVLCVRCALAVLGGAGLTVDPGRLYQQLYTSIIAGTVATNPELSQCVLETSWQVTSRGREVSNTVLVALSKRLLGLAVLTTHTTALAVLLLVYKLVLQNKSAASLLDTTEDIAGSGRYDPFLPSPEHCNPHAARGFELTLLTRQYHPTVRQAANNILQTPPNFPLELTKMTPTQIFKMYSSDFSFKPAIPPPKVKTNVRLAYNHTWVQSEVKDLCEVVEKNVDCNIDFSELLVSK